MSRTFACTAVLSLALLQATGCERADSTDPEPSPPEKRPNILLIVWDTVRADRMSLYGHTQGTTPYLDAWAAQARVYDECLSTAGTTVPSHAAMFTGLLPYQHGAHNEKPALAERVQTLAELFKADGYRTYMFSANPFIASANRFDQGFDLVQHPWGEAFSAEAEQIIRSKVPANDRTSELADALHKPHARLGPWMVKTAGALAQKGVEGWLSESDPGKPYLIFLNYMEAHRPLIPPDRFRHRFLKPEQVSRSHLLDRRWQTVWSYTFGLSEVPEGSLEITRGLYDAALAELDQLFHKLLASLEEDGLLDNTIIVLTSDHGEHLGEHHMLDHQFSVYQELLRVPLVLYYPPVVAPGREARPVMNFDVFPTLLAMANVNQPMKLDSLAVNLLKPLENRGRIAACPGSSRLALETTQSAYPNFDPKPWDRSLQAFLLDPFKMICGSDGRHELYDLRTDPYEAHNLFESNSDDAQRLMAQMTATLSQLEKGRGKNATYDEEEIARLRSLGYTGSSSSDDRDSAGSSCEPSSQPNRPIP